MFELQASAVPFYLKIWYWLTVETSSSEAIVGSPYRTVVPSQLSMFLMSSLLPACENLRLFWIEGNLPFYRVLIPRLQAPSSNEQNYIYQTVVVLTVLLYANILNKIDRSNAH